MCIHQLIDERRIRTKLEDKIKSQRKYMMYLNDIICPEIHANAWKKIKKRKIIENIQEDPYFV